MAAEAELLDIMFSTRSMRRLKTDPVSGRHYLSNPRRWYSGSQWRQYPALALSRREGC